MMKRILLLLRILLLSGLIILIFGFNKNSQNPFIVYRTHLGALWLVNLFVFGNFYFFFKKEFKIFKFNKNIYFLLLFLLFFFSLRVFFSKYIFLSILSIPYYYGAFFIVFFSKEIVNKKFIEKTVFLILYIIFPICFIYSIMQYNGIELLYNIDNVDPSKIFSFFGGKNMYAFFLFIILLLFSYKRKIYFIVVYLLCIPIIIYIRTRSVWIIVFLLTLCYLKNIFKFKKRLLIFMMLIIIILSLNLIIRSFERNHTTVNQRVFIYKTALITIKNNLFTGVCTNNFILEFIKLKEKHCKNWKSGDFLPPVQKATLIHNDTIQFIVEWGIIIFFICLILFKYYLNYFINKKKYNVFFIFCVFMLIHSLVTFDFHIPFFYLIFWIFFSFSLIKTDIMEIKLFTFYRIIFLIFINLFCISFYFNIVKLHIKDNYIAKTFYTTNINKKLKYFENALQFSNITDSRLYFEIAVLFMELNNFENAEYFLKKALYFPIDDSIYSNLAICERKSKKYENEFKYLKKAININPLNINSQKRYLVILRNKKIYKELKTHLNKIKQQIKENPDEFRSNKMKRFKKFINKFRF